MILYRTADDKRKITKTLVEVKSVKNFKLKDNTSILNPVILLKNADLTTNYCFISKFNRYYFIDDIVTRSDGLTELRCSVDVLYTYNADILKINTFIERQETAFNPYIVDNELITRCERALAIKSIGTIGTATGSYIALTVTGGEAVESEVNA